MTIGGSNIIESSSNYGVLAFLQTLLSHDATAKETELAVEGWHQDGIPGLDPATAGASAAAARLARRTAGEGYVQAIGEREEEEEEEEAVEMVQVLLVVLRDCVGKYVILLTLLSMTCALSSSTMAIHLGLVTEGGMGTGNGETTDNNNTNDETDYCDNDSSDHGSVSSSDFPLNTIPHPVQHLTTVTLNKPAGPKPGE